jgi:hypothetical protein
MKFVILTLSDATCYIRVFECFSTGIDPDISIAVNKKLQGTMSIRPVNKYPFWLGYISLKRKLTGLDPWAP